MNRTVLAEVLEDGTIRPLDPIDAPKGERVWVTLQSIDSSLIEPALLSEKSLGVDWDRPEEDEAWSYLQQEKS
jgi:predicted DNA-binding antitoxin AbrB/MazE fold protein